MVLFCLNQIGNRIPNPFSHSAMWLPHSIKAAHNLWQRRGPAWWHLFQGNGCTSDLCDLGKGTFASWEVSTEAIPLGACVWEWGWHVVAGIQSIFENRWMGKNAIPSLFTLPSLHHSLLHSSSAWFHDKCLCTVSKERNGTGSPTLEHHWCLIFVQVAYLCGNRAVCPYLPLPQTIWSWEPHEKVHPREQKIYQANSPFGFLIPLLFLVYIFKCKIMHIPHPIWGI